MRKKVTYVPGAYDDTNYEKTVCIETHENVTVEYEIAGVGSRYIAGWFDRLFRLLGLLTILIPVVIVLWTSYSLLELLKSLVDNIVAYYYAFFAVYLGYILLTVVYHLIAELVTSGGGPGKSIIGIKVVQVTGEAATPVQLIVRNLLRLIDLIPGGSIIDGIIALWDKQGRRVGDIAAGTMVIKYRKGFDLNKILAMAEAEESEKDEDAILLGETDDNPDFVKTEDKNGAAALGNDSADSIPDEEIITDTGSTVKLFFNTEETEALRQYLACRREYVNRYLYDQRFAELIAQRRGFEKTSGFTNNEALDICRGSYMFLTEQRNKIREAELEAQIRKEAEEQAKARETGFGYDPEAAQKSENTVFGYESEAQTEARDTVFGYENANRNETEKRSASGSAQSPDADSSDTKTDEISLDGFDFLPDDSQDNGGRK